MAYWLERRIRDRDEDFEREFDSHLRILFRDSCTLYNHRSNHISLLSGYPDPAATQLRIRGLRPARDGYKLQNKTIKDPIFISTRPVLVYYRKYAMQQFYTFKTCPYTNMLCHATMTCLKHKSDSGCVLLQICHATILHVQNTPWTISNMPCNNDMFKTRHTIADMPCNNYTCLHHFV